MTEQNEMFDKPNTIEIKITPSISYIGGAGEKISVKPGEVILNLLWFGDDGLEVAKMLRQFEEQVASSLWQPTLTKGKYNESSDSKLIIQFSVMDKKLWDSTHKTISTFEIPYTKSGDPIERIHDACLIYFMRWKSLETAVNNAVYTIVVKPTLYTKEDLPRLIRRIFYDQKKQVSSWIKNQTNPVRPIKTGSYWNVGVYKWNGGYRDADLWTEIVKSVVLAKPHSKSHIIEMIKSKIDIQRSEQEKHKLISSYIPAWARKSTLPDQPEDEPVTIDAVESAAKKIRGKAKDKVLTKMTFKAK